MKLKMPKKDWSRFRSIDDVLLAFQTLTLCEILTKQNLMKVKKNRREVGVIQKYQFHFSEKMQ